MGGLGKAAFALCPPTHVPLLWPKIPELWALLLCLDRGNPQKDISTRCRRVFLRGRNKTQDWKPIRVINRWPRYSEWPRIGLWDSYALYVYKICDIDHGIFQRRGFVVFAFNLVLPQILSRSKFLGEVQIESLNSEKVKAYPSVQEKQIYPPFRILGYTQTPNQILLTNHRHCQKCWSRVERIRFR